MSDTTSDRRAIEALLVAYCWANDAGRVDDIADTFHVDATYSALGDLVRGRAAIRELFDVRVKARATQPIADPQHWVSNIRIEIDGEHARASSYYLRIAATEPAGDVKILAHGWYDDVLRKEDGRWRFQHRAVCKEIPE